MTSPVYPAKPEPGDAIAVLSPSSGLPGILPLPYELGLRRLRENFGLKVMNYPTTRRMGSTPEARAADLHAAFADPAVKAVIASIGGDDQITVLPHLDRELLRANPKPFFGYSDNTNLLVFLSNLGLVGYHGGSVMVELGRPVSMHPLTEASLRAAIFSSGPFELTAAERTGTEAEPWEESETFEKEPLSESADGWTWHNATRVVEGPSWGGNLEILSWMMMADREILPAVEYAGRVLFLETSEELPRAEEVYRILRNMGERGLLRQFPALLMGRAKAWSFEARNDAGQRAAYRKAQHQAVLRAVSEYAPDTVVVLDVDIGHTDPQLVIPFGGSVTVDGPAQKITVTY